MYIYIYYTTSLFICMYVYVYNILIYIMNYDSDHYYYMKSCSLYKVDTTVVPSNDTTPKTTSHAS